MVDFKTALKTAKKYKPDTDNYTEYKDAYVFGCHEDDNSSGGSGPCVVLKEDGKAVNMAFFMTRYDVGEPIQEGDI